MVAAELFCGMEQTTTRVEPVAVITDPGCGLVPTIRKSLHKGKKGKILWKYINTRGALDAGIMSTCVMGARRHSVGIEAQGIMPHDDGHV